MMKNKKRKTRLIIWLVCFAVSYVISFILGIKLKEELAILPTKEEDYLPNF